LSRGARWTRGPRRRSALAPLEQSRARRSRQGADPTGSPFLPLRGRLQHLDTGISLPQLIETSRHTSSDGAATSASARPGRYSAFMLPARYGPPLGNFRRPQRVNALRRKPAHCSGGIHRCDTGRFSYVRDPCCVSRGTFGLADAQVPHSYVGTGKRCVAVSNGSRCRPRGRAPPALWTGDHRAHPLDTPEVAGARKTRC